MKKIISLLLISVLCFGAVGCDSYSNTEDTVEIKNTEPDNSSEESFNESPKSPETPEEPENTEIPEEPEAPSVEVDNRTPNSIILRTCSFDTAKYDLAQLIDTGSSFKVTKDGKVLDSTTVNLSTGTNIFRVSYTVDDTETLCEVRIARRDKYRVVLNSNGGSFVETQYVEDCGTVDASAVEPTRDRYTFLGWYNEYGKKVDLSTMQIAEDTTFTARWDGPNTFATPSKTPISYTTASAALNIVWKDYDNAFKLRPSEVLCELKNTETNVSYTVKITKSSAEFVGVSPQGASVSCGEGNWTVKISGLTSEYTFTANPLDNENYKQSQSGTALTCTLNNYDSQQDDTVWLMTENGRFYDIAGNMVVLKGIVTLNPGWNNFSENTSTAYLSRMQKEGANCVRMTMMLGKSYYHTTNLEKRQELIDLIKAAIKRATELGMYCIVDWGVLMQNDNTQPENGYLPNYQESTNEFFAMLAEENLYNPYIVYEICNEPTVSGSDAWEKHVRPFEESVIRAIRSTGSQSVIIAAPNMHARWLSDDSPAQGDDPIDKPFSTDISHNIAYTFHCYAYTTTYDITFDVSGRVIYGWRLCDAIKNGLTIVVTEFSPATADINAQSTGGLDADFYEADKYLNVMLVNDVSFTLFRGISDVASKKTSSQHMFIKGNVEAVNTGVWTYEMLSDSGRWFYDKALNSTGFIPTAPFGVKQPT